MCSIKRAAPKNFTISLESIFIGVLFNQDGDLEFATFQNRGCFAVNFVKFLRAILCRTTAAPGRQVVLREINVLEIKNSS